MARGTCKLSHSVVKKLPAFKELRATLVAALNDDSATVIQLRGFDLKENMDQLQEFLEYLVSSTDLCDHRTLRVWLAMGKLADSSILEETLNDQQTRLAVDILFSHDEIAENGSPAEESQAAKSIQRLWRMRRIRLAKYSLASARTARLKMEQDVVATMVVRVCRAIHLGGGHQQCFFRVRLSDSPFHWETQIGNRQAPFGVAQSLLQDSHRRQAKHAQRAREMALMGVSMVKGGVGGVIGGVGGVLHMAGGAASFAASGAMGAVGAVGSVMSGMPAPEQEGQTTEKKRRASALQRAQKKQQEQQRQQQRKGTPLEENGPGMSKWHFDFERERLPAAKAGHGSGMNVVDVTSDLIVEAVGLEKNRVTGAVSEKLLGFIVVPIARLLHGEHEYGAAGAAGATGAAAAAEDAEAGEIDCFRLKRLFRLFPPQARQLNDATKTDAREAMVAAAGSHMYNFDEGAKEPDWTKVGAVELELMLAPVAPALKVANPLARIPVIAKILPSVLPLTTMYFSRPAPRALAIAAAADAAAAAKAAEEQERKKSSNSSLELINVIQRVVATVTVLLAAWDRLYKTLALPRCVTTFFCTLQCIPTPGLSSGAANIGDVADFVYEPSEYSVPKDRWLKCAALYLVVVACVCFGLYSWQLPLLYLSLLAGVTWSVARLDYHNSGSNIMAHAWEEDEELEEWTLVETLEWIDELLDGITGTLDSTASSIEKVQLMFSWVDPLVTALAFAALAAAATFSSAILLVLQAALHLLWTYLGVGVTFLACISYFASCCITANAYFFHDRDSQDASGGGDRDDGGIGDPADLAEAQLILWFDFWPGGREKILDKHRSIFSSLGDMHHHANSKTSPSRRAAMAAKTTKSPSMRRWEGYTHSIKRLQFDVETNLKHKPASSNSFAIVAVYNNSSTPQRFTCTLDAVAARARSLARAGPGSRGGSFHSPTTHGIGGRFMNAGKAAGRSVLESATKAVGAGLHLGEALADVAGIHERHVAPKLMLLHQSGAVSAITTDAAERGEGELELVLQPYTSAMIVAYGGPKRGSLHRSSRHGSPFDTVDGVHLDISSSALVAEDNTALPETPLRPTSVGGTDGAWSPSVPAHRRGQHSRHFSVSPKEEAPAHPLWAASFAAGGAQLVAHQHPTKPRSPSGSEPPPLLASSSVCMDQLPKLPGYDKTAVYRLWINEEEALQGIKVTSAVKKFETKPAKDDRSKGDGSKILALATRLLAGMRTDGALREYTWRSEDMSVARDTCDAGMQGADATAPKKTDAGAGAGGAKGAKGGGAGASRTGVRDCFEGKKAVAWLQKHEPELCQEQCRCLDEVYDADETIQIKGAMRLGNVLRTAGFLQRVQPILPMGRHNQAGELVDHPCSSSSSSSSSTAAAAAPSAARFEASSSLYSINLRHSIAHGPGAAAAKATSKAASTQGRKASTLTLAQALSPASVGSRIGAFMQRLPDRKQMRHISICALAEAKVREEERT
jgi:hypothetical protein